MAKNKSKLKLNIIYNEAPVSQEEQDKRLLDFFALLFEWELQEMRNAEEA